MVIAGSQRVGDSCEEQRLSRGRLYHDLFFFRKFFEVSASWDLQTPNDDKFYHNKCTNTYLQGLWCSSINNRLWSTLSAGSMKYEAAKSKRTYNPFYSHPPFF